MRKMKKINGYLIVRFNDREKRERPELGAYGVIDAELYSGNLTVDLSAMEYTDADRIEIAVEQARDLNSEFDVEEPEIKVTIVKESDGETSEVSYDPVKMFDITRTLLELDIQKGMGEDIDPRTAAHELRGFAKALMTMGMVSGNDERFYVPLDCFGSAGGDGRPRDAPKVHTLTLEMDLPEVRENLLECIRNELRKYRNADISQEELDAFCDKCGIGKWAGVPPKLTPKEFWDLRRLSIILKELNDYTSSEPAAPPSEEGFRHFIKTGDDLLSRKVYRLGLEMEAECPDNGCIVYRNIFQMAQELDDALDRTQGYAAEVLRRELGKNVRELWRMYLKNDAVREYRMSPRNAGGPAPSPGTRY